jgi:TRAP-type mannitol/chloroaromatic compound transport system permease large subunit
MQVIILATLGVILAGIATPTDAGAVGAFAVLILTLAYRRLTWQKLKSALYSTLLVSSMILLLVAASNYFGAVFSRLGSATLIAESLLGLNFSPTVMLLLILAIIFVLGWPLEWVPIVLIVVPIILLPLVQKARHRSRVVLHAGGGVSADRVAFPARCVVGLLLRGVVPDWPLKDIYAGMMQFMVLQIVGLLLVLFFPQLALWLPGVLRE